MIGTICSLFYSLLSRIEKVALNYRLKMLSGKTANIVGRIHISATDIKLGDNVTFYPGAYLWGKGITIGDNVDVGINTIIYSRGGSECWK